MDVEPCDDAPSAGMIISVRTRRDVVVMDPERLLAAARRAYREVEGATEAEAAAAVSTVCDAVHALPDRFGRLGSDDPEVAEGGTEVRRMHGGFGLVPGDRVHMRPDGLSPAGEVTEIVLGEPKPLSDYGCFTGGLDFFARPARPAGVRGTSSGDD